ncbi:hypothetical protein DL93DRAFT_1171584 [Clavulina sp. PMI_390]|nr:hypothetical protein DL93DRAFT_1171584 [Clavulina sp. PMI_390]
MMYSLACAVFPSLSWIKLSPARSDSEGFSSVRSPLIQRCGFESGSGGWRNEIFFFFERYHSSLPLEPPKREAIYL